MKQQQHLFTNKMLRALLVPIIMEQLLNALMGTVDTMMVSNVGSAAISAVSLVDSINVLIIQAFSALAAGGTIICTQYLGQKNHEMANKSARQALFIITAISVFIVVLGLAFRAPLLSFIFGKVDADVMKNSMVYFFYTVLSYPFIALYDASALMSFFPQFYSAVYSRTLSGIPSFSATLRLFSTFSSPIQSTTVNFTFSVYFLQSCANFSMASKAFSP